MTEAYRAALRSHFQRAWPAGSRATTKPTAVTAAAMAWPEGNDAPDVATRLPSGRGRSKRALLVPINASDVAMARENADRCSQWRRQARTIRAPMRSVHVHHAPPTKLRTLAS